MSDEKVVTEREAVMRERQAFRAGAWAFYWDDAIPSDSVHGAAVNRVALAASTRYPLPKVTRPRVVTDARGTSWRVIGDGTLQWKMEHARDWNDTPRDRAGPGDMFITRERVLKLADLLANPTEECEAES